MFRKRAGNSTGLCLFMVTASLLLVFTSAVFAATETDSLLTVLKKNLNPSDRIKTTAALGKAYYEEADYRNALETDRKLLELVGKNGSLRDSAQAFRHIGLVTMKMSWYEESLNYLMQATEYYSRLQDTAKMATSMMNVGIIHDHLGNIPMSYYYYQNALSYFIRIKDEFGMANCKLNMAILLTKEKKYYLAARHFQEAADIYLKLDNQSYLAAAYINLGLAYKNLKNYPLAEESMNKARQIYEKQNDQISLGYYHVNMGELLMKVNKNAEAKAHLDQALKSGKEAGSGEILARSYEFLSDYYAKVGNYKEAYEMLTITKQLSDSTINAEMVEKVSQIQYHYEIAKRETEKARLVKANLQKEYTLSRRNMMLYIMAGLLLLIAITVVMLLYWNRVKQKTNLALEAKNRTINAQKEELIKLNASKDKFLSILAHDIKNPLSAILGISDILNSDYQQLTEAQRQGFIRDILTSSTNLFDIVNALLNWSISQNGMISFQPKNFNIRALCGNTTDKLQTLAKTKDVKLILDEGEELSVFADDNMVMSVVHNLVCNAIKFSHSGSNIVVSTRKSGSFAEIAVSDSGIGISPENQQKLFRYDQNFRSKGTTGESGTGLGLLLCKEFVERNNGEIRVESELGKGSSFRFTLPLVF